MWTWLIILPVKLITIVFDTLTIPGYIIWQRPWKAISNAKTVRSAREDENDPESPFVRIGGKIPFDQKIFEGPTIAHWFDVICKKFANSKCLGTRVVLSELEEKQSNGKSIKKFIFSDEYSFDSYNQVNQKVNMLISGFTSNGIKSGDKVIIFSETRAEWLLSAFALWKLGAITVTMYANLGLEGISYILEQTEAVHMVTTADCLDKLSKISDQINHLKIVFCANSQSGRKFIVPSSLAKFNFISFDQLFDCAKTNVQQPTIKYPEPEDTFLIMYTSGSTGIPKGVQISHGNFITSVKGFLTSSIGAYESVPEDAYLAYLPLAHIFELAAEILIFSMGIPIYYSSPFTMFDSSPAIATGCKGDIAIVKPTVLGSVPLVLDRIKKLVEEKLSASNLIRDVFQFAYEYKKFWYKFGLETPLMDYLMFGKVRQALGGNIKLMYVGGAPLSPETQQFITLALGTKLLQGYAATEVTACGAIMDLGERSLGRCGAPFFGSKFKLINWPEGNYYNTDKPNPRGEIVIGGTAVSMGYFKNPEETEKFYWVDKEGTRWWRTGDIGEVFHDGTIKIIDRKKDLIKLQHGEYISLGKVESILKNCPYIDNICVYGDSFQSYLIAFVLPERNSLIKLAETLSLDTSNYESLCSDKKIIAKVLETMRDFGESKGLLKFELPNRIKLCTEEWTPDNGLVTAALKIRRLQIQTFYKQSIDLFYSKS